MKSSRERVAAIRVSNHGTVRLPPTRTSAVRIATLRAASPGLLPRQVPSAPTVNRRHHDEHEDGQQIFDDEPADRDVSGPRVQVAIVGEDSDEDNRAGDREADPEDQPRRRRPAECVGDRHPQARGDDALRNRSWNGDPPDGDQLLDVKLQPDAEHQQDDADFGELLGHVAIRHEAGRVWAHEEPGNQIPDDGGEPDAVCGKAEHQRRAQAAGQRKDEIDRMHRSIIVSVGSKGSGGSGVQGFKVQGSRFEP